MIRYVIAGYGPYGNLSQDPFVNVMQSGRIKNALAKGEIFPG